MRMKNPSVENQANLKKARHNLLPEKWKGKWQWQYTYASKCQKNDFIIKPKEAWEMVFILMEGFQKHHQTHLPSNFKNKNGTEAKNDDKNAAILLCK